MFNMLCSILNIQQKKALVLTKTFLFSFFPSTALPVSGTMSLFSGFPFEPPQKENIYKAEKTVPQKGLWLIVYGL